MAMTQQAPSAVPLSRAVDAIRESVSRLEAALPAGDDTAALLDFLEDDLREGLQAIAEVESHFGDILEVLREERPTPVRLLEVADDFRALSRLEYLFVVVSQLRKRLSQAAGRMTVTR